MTHYGRFLLVFGTLNGGGGACAGCVPPLDSPLAIESHCHKVMWTTTFGKCHDQCMDECVE